MHHYDKFTVICMWYSVVDSSWELLKTYMVCHKFSKYLRKSKSDDLFEDKIKEKNIPT